MALCPVLTIIRVTTQVPTSSPPPAALVFFTAGLAACGCQARSKNLLRTTAGGEES